MKKNKLLSSYVKKGTQPMKSPNLVSLSSSDNINNITFGDLDILDANSTKLVAGQSGSGISYEDIEGHLFESFISKNINVGNSYNGGVGITESEIKLAPDLADDSYGILIDKNHIRISTGSAGAEFSSQGISIGTNTYVHADDIKLGTQIQLTDGLIQANSIELNGTLSANTINLNTIGANTATFGLSISTIVQADNIAIRSENAGKLSIKNANNIALEILRTSVNSRVYMPLLGYTSNLNYTSLHACGGIFVGDQYFSAVENKYYPELSLHTHSGAWIHNIFSRSNMYRLSYAHKNNSDLSCTITIDTDGTIGGDAKIANQQDVTYQLLYNMRSNLKLIPGRFYRITDYVTTTMQRDTRSAGHLFDVIVRADSNSTLNETAWAAKHSGDTYFQNAKLEAWELKYNLDNVQWSQRVGTAIEGSAGGYVAVSIGTVDIDGLTYILWDASKFEGDYGFTQMVSLTKQVGADMWAYDPATGERGEDVQTSISTVIGEYTEAGKGTITWMKDEWGNIAGYDFKNIQLKRWKVTDELGRDSLNDKYLGVLHCVAAKLSIEELEDFIWTYLYSVYDYYGGTLNTADHSLSGYVHDMDTNFAVSNNNAFVWSSIYYYANGCKFSGNINNCSFSGNMWSNSFSGNLLNNSFSEDISNCSFLGVMDSCSFSKYVTACSLSGDMDDCSFSGYVSTCSFLGEVKSCLFSRNLDGGMITGLLDNLQIEASGAASVSIFGLYTFGNIRNKIINVTPSATYPIYVAMTTAGQLKIWNPADLVL